MGKSYSGGENERKTRQLRIALMNLLKQPNCSLINSAIFVWDDVILTQEYETESYRFNLMTRSQDEIKRLGWRSALKRDFYEAELAPLKGANEIPCPLGMDPESFNIGFSSKFIPPNPD